MFRNITFACITGATLMVGAIGCQPEQRPDVIPSSAQLMDSGNGKMHFTASDNGTVFVYDQPANKLVWAGKVMKGQAVDLDPMKNEVMANGNVVSMKTLNNGDRNDVYFMPAPMMTPPPTAMPNNPPQNYNSNTGNNYNGGLTVTPSVTVQPTNGNRPNGSLTVQPGLNVAPSTQPSQAAPTPAPAPAAQ